MTTRVGEVRPSQLMFTYGVGALIDLPKISVIVTGLEDWQLNPKYAHPVNRKPSAAGRAVPSAPVLRKCLLPPLVRDSGATTPILPTRSSTCGVPVATFPRWMVCPRCRILAPLSSNLFQLDENAFYHATKPATGIPVAKMAKDPEVLPARFLAACEKGHLDDFPWVEFAHRTAAGICDSPQLRLIEHGPSGEARDLEVRCENCKKFRLALCRMPLVSENREKYAAVHVAVARTCVITMLKNVPIQFAPLFWAHPIPGSRSRSAPLAFPSRPTLLCNCSKRTGQNLEV